MFFKCSQCKEVWQYPISKCPNCFIRPERLRSQKLKVKGVSKNTIPTTLHPHTPYFILVIEDENGNRWVHKTIKEYKIGDSFQIEENNNKNTVAVWRFKYDVVETIEKTLSLIKKIRIKNNSKILILPTLSKAKHPYLAHNTTPQFLAGTLHYLIQKGVNPSNIRVASQSFDETPIELSVEKSQILMVCQKAQVAPFDLSKTRFLMKKEGKMQFNISEEIFNSDLIINLPILNLDPKIKIKGAVNNLLKSLKKESYLSLKYLYSYEDIVINLNKILPEYLSLGEAIISQKEDEHVSQLGLVLASFNPFNLDRVFAKITSREQVPEYLKRIDLESIPVVGRQIKEVQYDIEKF